jgi:hypothetical protein
LIHRPADIAQASFSGGVLGCALTIAKLLFQLDAFHYGRPAIFQIVLVDVIDRVPETVANQVPHKVSPFNFI